LTLHEPTFPPLLSGRAVIKGEDPRALAVSGAASGELGAGDALWLQDTTRVELAIVLEPDDALTKAAQMLPLGMAAAGDCLATLAPPQVAVNYRWPGTILMNGGSAGDCTLTAPANCQPDEIPRWLVLALSLRFAFDDTNEPGTTPGITSLMEEGIEELTSADVIDSYSRHFLSLLDAWTNDGFSDVSENWAGRLEGLNETVTLEDKAAAIKVRTMGLDEDGNLLAKPTDGSNAIALELLECVERHSTDGTT